MLIFILSSAVSTPSDQAMLDSYINRISDGDTEAFELLYHETSTAVYAYALSILKNSADAEDVLHDCFIAIYSAAGTYESRGKPMAWIMTITKNLCLKRLREKGRFSPMSDDEIAQICEKNDVSEYERLILEECMKCLSDKERQIVVLHAVSGFRHREIAELMELPLSTVLSKYNRAVAKLRKRL